MEADLSAKPNVMAASTSNLISTTQNVGNNIASAQEQAIIQESLPPSKI